MSSGLTDFFVSTPPDVYPSFSVKTGKYAAYTYISSYQAGAVSRMHVSSILAFDIVCVFSLSVQTLPSLIVSRGILTSHKIIYGQIDSSLLRSVNFCVEWLAI